MRAEEVLQQENRQNRLNPIAQLQQELKQTPAGKVQVILKRIKYKLDYDIPMTAKEETLMAELVRYQHYRPKEKMTVDADGLVHVHRSNNAEPVMDAVKRYGDVVDKWAKNKAGRKMIGSLDPITAGKWAKECGARFGTQEYTQFAVKRLREDIDYRKFRVHG